MRSSVGPGEKSPTASRLKALDPGSLPVVDGAPRIGAPVGIVPKFFGIGLNYRDHAEETGMPIPEAPIVFAKANSCVSGPYDPVLAPKGWQRMDFEVELAVVIGSPAKTVAESDALKHVAGYCICNDVSERSLQVGGQQYLYRGQPYWWRLLRSQGGRPARQCALHARAAWRSGPRVTP